MSDKDNLTSAQRMVANMGGAGRQPPPRRPASPAPAISGLVRHEDGTMQYGSISMTSTALVIPDDLDDAAYKELGTVLFTLEGALSWWLGDYAVYGERKWKYTYDALAKAYEKEVETLYTYAGVARAIKPSIRNRGLSFAHHRLVQGIEDEAEQVKWLELAASKEWTVKQMAAAMQPVRPTKQVVTPYDALFAPAQFPELKTSAVKKLVVKAKNGDPKAYQELADLVNKTESWLQSLKELFAQE